MKPFLPYLSLAILVNLVLMPIYKASAQIVPDSIQMKDPACAQAKTRIMGDLLRYRGGAEDSIDILYHKLELEIDPAVRYVRGCVLTGLATGKATDRIVMDLSGSLQVTGIQSEGTGLTYGHIGDRLEIIPHLPLAAGDQYTFTVCYEGEPPSSGFGSFGQGEHNGAPMIWTLSEPYGARDWWPCRQNLADKIDSLDLLVTVTSGNRVASNGLLQEEVVLPDGRVRFHWKHRYPIATYLVAFVATNFEVFEDSVETSSGPLYLLSYLFPEHLQDGIEASYLMAELIQFFDTLIGPYPFMSEKYGHAEFGWGGGMEHQTMSFMGAFTYDLVTHELAHQWFGNKITCGSWHDIFLNEGFATYLTGLAYERFSNQLYWPQWKRVVQGIVTAQPGGSVYVPDTTEVSRIFNSRLSYHKGAYLLHMLRWVMGDAAFFGGLRTYIDDDRWRYGFARVQDFREVMEDAHGNSLEWFFEQWYYGEGYPGYIIHGELADRSFHIKVYQEQSHPSVPYFTMPLPLRLSGPGLDTLVVLDHRFDGQEFVVLLSQHVSHVDSIAIDPDRWLLSSGNRWQLIVTGREETVVANSLQLYPTPASDILWLSSESGALKLSKVAILSLSGRILQDHRVGELIAGQPASVDISSLAPGTYLLCVYGDENRPVAGMFVKE